MNSTENSSQGMPIYEDEYVRSVADSLDEDEESNAWYPANNMAIKLWQCLEALRDIEVALESASSQKNSTKRKRQLKQFSVQLHSFATAVARLCDQIIGDDDARRWLEKGVAKQISAIKSEFLELAPIDHNSDLSILRNRMGGHIDRDLVPWGAREILSRNVLSNLGKWLHVCLHVMLDLLKLDVYSWSVRSTPGYFRLMAIEPFLLTFEVDAGIKSLVAVHVARRSPRNAIADVIESVVRKSQWMFSSDEVRIGSLKGDDRAEWNTFTGSSVVWNSKIR